MLATILNIREISDFLNKAMEHQPRLYSHSVNTAIYAENIGNELHLDDQDMYTLVLGSTLHDAGKLRVPTRTLERPRSLTRPEWDLLHVHTLLGLIEAPDWISPDVEDIIRHHHEKLDGSGYPDNLTGNMIKPLTRIVTVADMFEAITAKRSYKIPSAKIDALAILQDDVKKGKLDKEIVDALAHSVEEDKTHRSVLMEYMSGNSTNAPNIID